MPLSTGLGSRDARVLGLTLEQGFAKCYQWAVGGGGGGGTSCGFPAQGTVPGDAVCGLPRFQARERPVSLPRGPGCPSGSGR